MCPGAVLNCLMLVDRAVTGEVREIRLVIVHLSYRHLSKTLEKLIGSEVSE